MKRESGPKKPGSLVLGDVRRLALSEITATAILHGPCLEKSFPFTAPA